MASPQDNIVSVFLRSASACPGRTAFIHNGRSISYEDLRTDVRRAAGSLRKMGVDKGDAVLVAVPMSIGLYTTVLALLYIGAIPVFLDAWVGRKRMDECLAAVPCRAIVAARKLLWLSLLFPRLRRIRIRARPESLLRGIPEQAAEAVDPRDTALITFTTGSTGPPKGANRTHEFLQAQLEALRPLLPAGMDISFTNLPIVVLLHIAMGKTTLLPPDRYVMKKAGTTRYLQEALQDQGVATAVVSPWVISCLVRQPALPRLRHIITGGGPVFPDLARAILDSFPDAEATIAFGSTEAEPISHISATDLAGTPTEDLMTYGLPVGFPDASATVRIIPWTERSPGPLSSDAFAAHQLPTGQAGEIVVSGPHVLERYINNPEAEAAHKFRVDGTLWHRTGDAGRIDSSGMLFFLGRCQEVIVHEGRPVYPLIAAYALRLALRAHDVAILMLDSRLTVAVCCHSSDRPAIPSRLAEHGFAGCRIEFIDHMPRDPRHLTKVDYAALRKQLRRRAG